MKDRDISVGKVNSLDEALADPQVVHRGMVVEVEAPGMPGGTVSQVGITPYPSFLLDTYGIRCREDNLTVVMLSIRC